LWPFSCFVEKTRADQRTPPRDPGLNKNPKMFINC
jgi:hypothetical protein